MTELAIFAAFMVGLLGGVHCAGMCGGIVSAISWRHPAPGLHPKSIELRLLTILRTAADASAATWSRERLRVGSVRVSCCLTSCCP